ncbi:hypothetical protein R3P38DRAFT_3231389 [Favolaschia claudopus]|uniref:Uncharacterized protein n=1 Tax=Favolaschia claudopus TaxID=2862362 RepID=A0AAV9ZKD4_9AGAR
MSSRKIDSNAAPHRSQRTKQASLRLMDPQNGETPSAPHQQIVGETIANSVSLITDLINKMDALTQQLPKSMYKATDQDKIYHVGNKVHGMDKNSASSTFIRRMDILFGHDCRDDDGHFQYISRGEHGMSLVVQYLRSIDWKSAGIPFTVAAVKTCWVCEQWST